MTFPSPHGKGERQRRAFERMRKLLSEREINEIEESMRRFREEFKLRS